MGKIIYKAVIPINPTTKKNSQEIKYNFKTKRRYIGQGEKYEQYESDAGFFLKAPKKPIDSPVNLKCIFYRKDKRKVDVSNLIEAIQDILVKYGILEDDNHTIVRSLDGCRVAYDLHNPRTEIFITEAK